MKYFEPRFKLLLVHLLLLIVLPVYSQSYHSVLKLNREWGVEFTTLTDSIPTISEGIYSLTDTVHKDSYIYYIPEYQIPVDSVIFREDSILKRVYAYNTYEQEEYIVMDFNLELGDTVPENFWSLDRFGFYEKAYLATVSVVDSIVLNDGSLRKRIIVQSDYMDCSVMEMIEGLGGATGFLSSGKHFVGHSRKLTCVKDDNALIYGICEPISIQEAGNANYIDIYPNPIINALKIDSKESIRISIYNINGQLLFRSKDSTHQHHIDFSTYDPGVYMIKGKDNNNKQSFVEKVIKI